MNENTKIEFDYNKGSTIERRTLFVTERSEALVKGIDVDKGGWRSFSVKKMTNIQSGPLSADQKRIVELALPDTILK